VHLQAGGQETTLMTAATQLAHHGMIFVPPGYTAGAVMMDNSIVRGGSPWGTGTVSGRDDSPSAEELKMAAHQGAHFAKVVMKLSK
jgi:NAD(P)H dehydrogenase (quinone)